MTNTSSLHINQVQNPQDPAITAVDVGSLVTGSSGVRLPIQPPQALFVEPSIHPTMTGAEKIRFDFNYGCRVELPPTTKGKKWKLRFTDMVTANVIFEAESEGGSFQSTKTYFVPFKIECWLDEKLVFTHALSLKDQLVQVQIPVGTLGDVIAWFPYIDLFQKKHQCKLVCVISDQVRPLFEGVYPLY